MAFRKDEHMTLKLFGALLVILSSAAFGFGYSSSYKKETHYLESLINALGYMQCDLEFRLTPLPELLQTAGNYCDGNLKNFFFELAKSLSSSDPPSMCLCVQSALERCGALPESCKASIIKLGKSLGIFGLSGQLEGIRSVQLDCEQILSGHLQNQEKHIRSYKTLALCAGAALVIIFI